MTAVMDAYGRWIHRADGALARLENALNLIGGVLIFGLMLLGVTQIILRTFFRTPIFGYIDIVEVSMVGFAVLSISYVQRIGGHVRMELLVSHLKGRIHWLAELVSTVVSIFIVTILIPFSYKHFARALNFGDSTIDIELSTWPAKLVVPFALSILLVRLVIQLFGYWRLVLDPTKTPVGVPVLKRVEEVAEEEILQSEDDIRHEHLTDAERGGRDHA